ncbi:hypothetical protein ACIBL3_20910 [Kribbella sp. NPDC050124]|uniref:hypothetical protein n=1 Tax=Kribbella sp. NPDC050124 TaxID=3364114 RepID=UPI0037A82B8D
MSQTKTGTPAGKPDEQKGDAWHRHPALIAAIPAVGAVIGAALTIFLGQSGALPAAINPAPAPTTVLATQTVTASSTITETVLQTPTVDPTTEPSGTVPTLETPPPGKLAVTIRIGSGGKIGPAEYQAGATPGANADVFDETGRQLNRGCYPTWTLKRGQTTVHSVRGTACEGNGFTMFSFRDALKTPGLYHLTVSVVTDGGATGTATADFKVS